MTEDENNALDAITLSHDAHEGEAVLRKVYDFLGRFVAYPSEDARVAHTLWCAHTHFMDAWDTTPRIAFLSAEPASGKTRALEISELLVPNPVPTMNATPAFVVRSLTGEGSATILYDEVDALFGAKAKDNEDTRALLNAGYRRGATIGRCVIRGNTIETERLPAFAAVALAGLGWLPDTVMTRSIVIRMRKRLPTEKVEPYRRKDHAPDGERVRCAIELWARSIKDSIIEPELPPDIVDRDADVWGPLITVAAAASPDWHARAIKAALALLSANRDQGPTLGVQLLHDCRVAFGSMNEIPTKVMLAALIAMPESPWGNLRGEPLDDRGLAQRLREFQIRPTNIRTSPESTPRGYRRADFIDAWERYCPTSGVEGKTSKTSKTECQGSPSVEDPPDPEGWSFNIEDQPSAAQ